MSDFNGSITRKAKVVEVALWTGAALVTLGVHVGAAAWMLRTEPVAAADNSPPAAIMIEIADVPQATVTEIDEISPDQKQANESVAQMDRKEEEKLPEKPVEQLTEPEVEKPVEEEVTEEKPVPLEKVEVPLPVAPPKPPEKKNPKKEKSKGKKAKPRKQQATVDSKAAIQAQAQVQQSDRTAATQTTSGLFSMSPANWQSQLMAHLERRKRYPSGARSRGERGTVYVRFTIDASGNVQSASLARSSGFVELDQEVLALVRRASPVPAPPPGANRTITAPVRFSAN